MRGRGQQGFTVIELIVVVAILGILAVLAVPDLLHSLAVRRLRGDAADLRGAFQLARVAAIGQGSSVVVQANPQGLPTVTQYIVFIDNGTDIAGAVTAGAANNQVWDGCEVLISVSGRPFGLLPGGCTFDNLPPTVLRALSNRVQFNPPPANIVFGSSGSRVQPFGLAPAAVTLQNPDFAIMGTVTVTAIGEVM